MVAAKNSELLEMVECFVGAAPPPRVKDTIDRIHEEWNRVPSVKVLADSAGITPQYLCRIFKKALGITIQQYAVLLRLDYARSLIWGTGLPIADIAAQTGFADQSHLTRIVTAHSDLSPTRLRLFAPCNDDLPRVASQSFLPDEIGSYEQ